MMTDVDPQFEQAVQDPRGIRDPQLAAVLVLRTLLEKNLPVADWQMRRDTGCVVQIEGAIYRHDYDGDDVDDVKRAAFDQWVTAFDAKSTGRLSEKSVCLIATFSYAGVPVEITTFVTRPGVER